MKTVDQFFEFVNVSFFAEASASCVFAVAISGGLGFLFGGHCCCCLVRVIVGIVAVCIRLRIVRCYIIVVRSVFGHGIDD